MDAGVHLALEDGLGCLDGQRCHLLSQGLAGLHGLLLRLGAGGGHDLGAFLGSARLGFLDRLLGQALGISQTLGRVVAGRGQLLLDTLVGRSQIRLGLVGG